MQSASSLCKTWPWQAEVAEAGRSNNVYTLQDHDG